MASDKGNELIEALNAVEKEKGIDKETIFEALEISLETACKRNYDVLEAKVEVDRQTGEIRAYTIKTVVEEVFDDANEITVEDAYTQTNGGEYQIDDKIQTEVDPYEFGAIAARIAKHVVLQKLLDAERVVLYEKYLEKKDEMYSGMIRRRDENDNIIVTIDDNVAIMPLKEQIPGEKFERGEVLPVYVTDIKQTGKGYTIVVSRACPNIVSRLFEQEVPEIFDGTIEVKSVARDAGSRTKIAVHSNDKSVDPLGACVGANGIRVNSIVNSLKGEMIDIIKWSPDPRLFIAEALSPSNVVAVELNEEEGSAKVVVPDDQPSLAIGKRGQNASLAVRLTGWKIDIKSESQSDEIGFVSEDSYYFRETPYVPPVKEEIEEVKENEIEDAILEEVVNEDISDLAVQEAVQEITEENTEL